MLYVARLITGALFPVMWEWDTNNCSAPWSPLAASTCFQIPGAKGGPPNPNLFHLLLQGVQGVSPGQQLLQAPQLPLLLLAVLLLLLLQGSDLGLIAADGVWQGRKGRGEGGSVC